LQDFFGLPTAGPAFSFHRMTVDGPIRPEQEGSANGRATDA
jgi:hypothetical protein